MMETEQIKTIKPATAYEVVIIDTINQIQNDTYVSLIDEKTMVGRDEWRDFGTEILMLYKTIRELGCELLQVLGYEGSGKSYGIKFLNPETTLWLHCDRKPITFKGGKHVYKKEYKNYSEPKSYDDVKKLLRIANDNRVDKTKPLIVFVLGHIEDFKSENGTIRQRLKVLGKMATKLNIEGSLSNCFYTRVTNMGDTNEYKLEVNNNGSNTARSMEQLFPSNTIDNNFQLIVDAINKY